MARSVTSGCGATGSGGRLALGTWQGIYLCEHRIRSHSRSIVVTVIGRRLATG